MFRNIFNYTLIASTIRLSTPLILAALGGLYSEPGQVSRRSAGAVDGALLCQQVDHHRRCATGAQGRALRRATGAH